MSRSFSDALVSIPTSTAPGRDQRAFERLHACKACSNTLATAEQRSRRSAFAAVVDHPQQHGAAAGPCSQAVGDAAVHRLQVRPCRCQNGGNDTTQTQLRDTCSGVGSDGSPATQLPGLRRTATVPFGFCVPLDISLCTENFGTFHTVAPKPPASAAGRASGLCASYG